MEPQADSSRLATIRTASTIEIGSFIYLPLGFMVTVQCHMAGKTSTQRAKRPELFEATVRFEHAAIKPLYLLNGGAIVAAIAFLGNAPEYATGVVSPLKLWIAGLVLATATTGAGYFSQFYFFKSDGQDAKGNTKLAGRWGKAGVVIRRFAYLFGAASIACFAFGAWRAVDALASRHPPC